MRTFPLRWSILLAPLLTGVALLPVSANARTLVAQAVLAIFGALSLRVPLERATRAEVEDLFDMLSLASMFGLLVAMVAASAGLEVAPVDPRPDDWLRAVVYVLGAPVSEEMLFRVMLLRALAPRCGIAGAVGIQAVLFAAAHHPAPWNALIYVAAGYGLAIPAAVWPRYGVLVSMVLHAAWNALVYSR